MLKGAALLLGFQLAGEAVLGADTRLAGEVAFPPMSARAPPIPTEAQQNAIQRDIDVPRQGEREVMPRK